MSHVHIRDANIEIPIYDSHALRLIRLPAFRLAKVGTPTVSQVAGIMRVHALKNLNLDLSDGERLCLIGHNGAGKSTLLRLIAGIYPTTSGSIDVQGKVFPLLGSGIALSNDSTGYENIDLAASLYDWPKSRLPEFIRDIEEFTELGEYLSLPTRVYSAGMQARLSFAVATMQSPDILLIDEGIGSADAAFRDKAQARVKQFVHRAKIIVLASHSEDLCRALCNKGLLLSKGERIFYGDVDEALARYGEHR
jgi:ABC-type polysaccharide/polyol phosphate transport system ATPase subunit